MLKYENGVVREDFDLRKWAAIFAKEIKFPAVWSIFSPSMPRQSEWRKGANGSDGFSMFVVDSYQALFGPPPITASDIDRCFLLDSKGILFEVQLDDFGPVVIARRSSSYHLYLSYFFDQSTCLNGGPFLESLGRTEATRALVEVIAEFTKLAQESAHSARPPRRDRAVREFDNPMWEATGPVLWVEIARVRPNLRGKKHESPRPTYIAGGGDFSYQLSVFGAYDTKSLQPGKVGSFGLESSAYVFSFKDPIYYIDIFDRAIEGIDYAGNADFCLISNILHSAGFESAYQESGISRNFDVDWIELIQIGYTRLANQFSEKYPSTVI